jgi:hypothetical protein
MILRLPDQSIVLAAALLLLASSAGAQTPIVLTNADLGKPARQHVTMTPAQWQTLVDHQFVYVPPPRWADVGGGRVAVAGTSWQPYIPPTYPLQPYFYMRTYVGRRDDLGPWRRPAPAPSATPRAPRAPSGSH